MYLQSKLIATVHSNNIPNLCSYIADIYINLYHQINLPSETLSE